MLSKPAKKDLERGRKFCTHCKAWHALSKFDTYPKHGLTYYQTKCKEYFKEYRQENSQRYASHVRAWRQRNPEYKRATPRSRDYVQRMKKKYYDSKSKAFYEEMFECDRCDVCETPVKGSQSALVYSNVKEGYFLLFCCKECAEEARNELFPKTGQVQSLAKKQQWYERRKHGDAKLYRPGGTVRPERSCGCSQDGAAKQRPEGGQEP